MTITIPEVQLLGADEEVRLARAIEAGVLAEEALAGDLRPGGASEAELVAVVEAGNAAHQEFFVANLRMAAQLAHRWAKRSGLPADELFQEACVGLGEAIRRWDHQRGLRFSSMAFSRIDWAISEAVLLRCGQLETSRFHARAALETQRVWQELEAQHGRSVTISEVAQHLGRDVNAVVQTLRPESPCNLSDELIDVLATDEQVGAGSELPEWMGSLPEQERIVLEARFGFGGPVATRAVLAAKLHVSQSTIKRIEQRAIDRARRMLRAA